MRNQHLNKYISADICYVRIMDEANYPEIPVSLVISFSLSNYSKSTVRMFNKTLASEADCPPNKRNIPFSNHLGISQDPPKTGFLH
jgi:hypothetical protein